MKRLTLFLLLSLDLTAAFPQWVQVCADFTPNNSIAAYDSTVIAGIYASDTYDLAVSYDAGNTWSGTDPFPGISYLMTLYAGNSWVYACTSNGLYRADKDSLNWAPYNEGLPSSVKELIERDSILLAYYCDTLYIRYLQDSAWTVLSDSTGQDGITGIDFDGNLIVVAGNNGVCESYDMGVSWSFWTDLQFMTGKVIIKGDTIIHASPGGLTRKLISTGSLANVSGGLIKLWTPPPGWDYYGTFEQFHKIGNSIFLCGETGVYKLNDNIWYWEHTGLGNWVNGLADNGVTLFAEKGYGGIWGRPLDQLIVGASENHLPIDSFMVYPNPSSNETCIVFECGVMKEIELSLLNLNGQVVKSIFKGELNKGTYRFTLNCRDLAKGIYIARLQSDNNIIAKKLVIR